MQEEKSSSPGILSSLILIVVMGVVFVTFLGFARSCAKTADEKAGLKTGAAAATAPAKVASSTDQPKSEAGNSQPVAKQTPETSPVAVTDSTDRPTQPEAAREVATSSPEGAAMLKDAVARIDEAPADVYPEKAKAKVRDGLKGARRIFKVGTVYFEKGGAKVLQRDKDNLVAALKTPSIQEASSDPRAVYFVLGFADMSGNADTNNQLSYQRADSVISMMESEIEVFNLIYPVAVGSSQLVSPENQKKNRAAEVWLVLP